MLAELFTRVTLLVFSVLLPPDLENILEHLGSLELDRRWYDKIRNADASNFSISE